VPSSSHVIAHDMLAMDADVQDIRAGRRGGSGGSVRRERQEQGERKRCQDHDDPSRSSNVLMRCCTDHVVNSFARLGRIPVRYE
jgi:hypothetical protein